LNELKNAKLLAPIYKNSLLKDPFNGRLKKQFVLPDYHKILKGYVKEDDVVLSNDEQVIFILLIIITIDNLYIFLLFILNTNSIITIISKKF